MHAQQPPRIVISAGRFGSLSQVLECARILTSLDRISIVVPAHDTAHARVEIGWYDGIEIVVQVREQRTTDVLIPLAQAFARDPLASIVFLPAEFSIAEPHCLAEAIRAALRAYGAISVIGMTPFEWRGGKDCNPVVAVGPVLRFWDLLRAERPLNAALLENYVEAIGSEEEGTALITAYERMQPLDFKDLLGGLDTVDVTTLSAAALRSRSSIVAAVSRRRVANAKGRSA